MVTTVTVFEYYLKIVQDYSYGSVSKQSMFDTVSSPPAEQRCITHLIAFLRTEPHTGPDFWDHVT